MLIVNYINLFFATHVCIQSVRLITCFDNDNSILFTKLIETIMKTKGHFICLPQKKKIIIY